MEMRSLGYLEQGRVRQEKLHLVILDPSLGNLACRELLVSEFRSCSRVGEMAQYVKHLQHSQPELDPQDLYKNAACGGVRL